MPLLTAQTNTLTDPLLPRTKDGDIDYEYPAEKLGLAVCGKIVETILLCADFSYVGNPWSMRSYDYSSQKPCIRHNVSVEMDWNTGTSFDEENIDMRIFSATLFEDNTLREFIEEIVFQAVVVMSSMSAAARKPYAKDIDEPTMLQKLFNLTNKDLLPIPPLSVLLDGAVTSDKGGK